MALSRSEVKQLFERLIFDDDAPQEWVQDVWGLSPTLGETAATLLEVFNRVLESCPEDALEDVLNDCYQDDPRNDIG